MLNICQSYAGGTGYNKSASRNSAVILQRSQKYSVYVQTSQMQVEPEVSQDAVKAYSAVQASSEFQMARYTQTNLEMPFCQCGLFGPVCCQSKAWRSPLLC